MSQLKFTTQFKGQPVLVVTGYDRMLDYCHFTVFSAAPDGEVLYSELNYKDAFKATPEDIIRKLDELKIPYPAPLFEQLDLHKRLEIGNLVSWLWVHAEDEELEEPDAYDLGATYDPNN